MATFTDKQTETLYAMAEATIGETIVCETRGVSVSVRVRDIPPHNLLRAMGYGVEKVGMDSVSGFKDKPDTDVIARIEERYATLTRGEWVNRTASVIAVAKALLLKKLRGEGVKFDKPAREAFDKIKTEADLGVVCDKHGRDLAKLLANARKVIDTRNDTDF